MVGSYVNYKVYWEEVVMCYVNDIVYGDKDRVFLFFEDYVNIVYDFFYIDIFKLVVFMWIVDDLYIYIDLWM